MVRLHLGNAKEWLTKHERISLYNWPRKAAKDDCALRLQSPAHRMRLSREKTASELRLGSNDLSAVERTVIEAGNTLMDAEDGSMRIAKYTQLPPNSWGFQASKIRQDAEATGWKDMYLLASIFYGFKDYEPCTTRVCIASPHQNAASQNPEKFLASVDNEIEKRWLRSPSVLTPTNLFRAITGNVVPNT